MKIIISPAKKMKECPDDFPADRFPQFLEEAEQLCQEIRKLSFEEAKALWKCNDKLTELNFHRFARMDLKKAAAPALLAYEGLQYQHMAPVIFTREAADYVGKHLRILSGFYGVLRPFDKVTPYRLEMQAALQVGEKKNLYEFWGERLYQDVLDEDKTIVNLASKEYSKAVEKYLQQEDCFLTIVFGELQGGAVKQKGTFAKMVRGEMVRFMAENQIVKLERLQEFCALGYRFAEEYSTEKEWVFLRRGGRSGRSNEK